VALDRARTGGVKTLISAKAGRRRPV
jgi:hypothetical protein